MKFVIIAIGSRGDVQPFLALGKGLKEKGHHIRICAMDVFQKNIEQEGFEYAYMAGDARKIMLRLIGNRVTPLEYFGSLPDLLNPVKTEFLKNIEEACQGMDAVLYSTLGSVAYHVGEKLGLPCFRCFFAPQDPTVEFPAMTAPTLLYGGWYNKLTYKCGDILWSHATRRLLNSWRTQMGLRKIKPFEFPYRKMNGKPIPTLYAYSHILAPKPKDYGEHQYVTGFWIKEMNQDWTPDEKLQQFLDRGTKPIYIGFGSTVGGNFNRTLKIIFESLKKTGQRAVLSAGWRNLDGIDLPTNVMEIGNVPHEWLFPQMLAVSHHGGAGTTAAGVRAGVPGIIVPFGGDQLYWGDRVYQMGIGTKPIWCNELSVENYTKAIQDVVDNQQMKDRASIVGAMLRSENGTANAIAVIENELNINN